MSLDSILEPFEAAKAELKSLVNVCLQVHPKAARVDFGKSIFTSSCLEVQTKLL